MRRFNDVSEIATVNWNDLVGSCQDGKALARKQEHPKLAGVLEDRLEAARVASVGRRRQLEVLKLRLAAR